MGLSSCMERASEEKGADSEQVGCKVAEFLYCLPVQGHRVQITTISATAVPNVWPPDLGYRPPGKDNITRSMHKG